MVTIEAVITYAFDIAERYAIRCTNMYVRNRDELCNTNIKLQY